MRRTIFCSILYCFLLTIAVTFSLKASSIHYITPSGAGTGDGSSWANASSDLQVMINLASDGDQIWVAGGTYKPLYSASDLSVPTPNNRHNAFVLTKAIKIYGGFAGTEVNLMDRNLQIKTNASILDGDLGGAGIADNAYHVLIICGDKTAQTGSSLLDGFTIKNGNADLNDQTTVNGFDLYNAYGAGIYAAYSSTNLNNVNFTGNTAFGGGYGGAAMYAYQSQFYLHNSMISGNTTTTGAAGAIYCDGCLYELTNVLLFKNKADNGLGGAINNEYCDCSLTNVTMFGNRARYNGAIFIFKGSLKIRNSLVVHNNSLPVNGGYNNSVASSNGENNIFIDYSFVDKMTNSTDEHHNLDGTTGPTFLNTSIGDYRLASTSIGINAGSNLYYAAGSTPDLSAVQTDLGASPRINGPAIDLGAYETDFIAPDVNGVLYVDQNGPGGDGGSWAQALPSLNDALTAATANTAIKQIWVAEGTYQPEDGTSFSMVENVKIYGGFAGNEQTLDQRSLNAGHNSVLKGNNARVIDNNLNNLTGAAILDGFIITGGSAITPSGNGNQGGGMLIIDGSPTLSNLVFYDNEAGTSGGGLDLVDASPIMFNIIFADNRLTGNGGSGGGLNINNGSAPKIYNVSFSGNKAPSGNYGAGLYKEYNSQAKINNAVFWGNTTGSDNSDIYYDGTNPADIYSSYLQNTTLTTGGIQTGNILNAANPFVNALSPAGPDHRWGTEDDGLQLATGSPCINGGDNSPIEQLPVLKDIRGAARIQDGTVDMGPYETAVVYTPTAGILYVKKNQTGTIAGTIHDGSSWTSAISELSDALKVAASLNEVTPGTVSQIWVAGGSYQPLYSANDGATDNTPGDGAYHSFVLLKDIKIYGSFAGNESTLAERIIAVMKANPSILNDNISSVEADRPAHVVISVSDAGSAELNGFTILNGYAHQANAQQLIVHGESIKAGYGGGIYLLNSSPILSKLIIQNNFSSFRGGGIYSENSSAFISDVVIMGNVSNNGGAGISDEQSDVAQPSLTLTNVVFGWNSATGYGGAMYNEQTSPVLTNVTISNSAPDALYNWKATPKLYNSIIFGNQSGISNTEGSTPLIAYSLIQGLGADNATHRLDGAIDPLFLDPTAGNYRLGQNSVAIDAGNNAFFAPGNLPDLSSISMDIIGAPRFVGTIDLGAFETAGALPIELFDFTAKALGNRIQLRWQTGVESGFNHLEIMRSLDGKTFRSIQNIPLKGSNSMYEAFDTPIAPVIYYRLKMVDNNNQVSYSKTKTVSMDIRELPVYPNPAKDEIHVQLTISGTLYIYNSAGRLEYSQSVQPGLNTINIRQLNTGIKYGQVGKDHFSFIKK